MTGATPSASTSLPSVPSFSSRFKLVASQVLHHAKKHTGVGMICAVAYFDPGNWGVDLQAGSQFGYRLLFIVLLSGLFAVYLQVLATRLGCVTGLDLASHTRLLLYNRPKHTLLYRWLGLYPLYALAEIAIIATDLAEVLGSAIALSLLFPKLELWHGVLITGFDVILILGMRDPLRGRPVKVFEIFIAVMVLAVLICMVVIISKINVNWADAFQGYLPSKYIFKSGGLYTSVGILGATVMPHSLFLGSALATQDRIEFKPTNELILTPNQSKESQDTAFIHAHLWHGVVDMVVSLLGFAVIINSLILILAAAVFYRGNSSYQGPASLFDAYDLIREIVGKPAATLFAIALLASGQSSSIIATVAGQAVAEGFLQWRVSPIIRRLLTRLLAMIPSMIVAIAIGRSGIDTLLVASQVVLSIVLPFITFPLLYCTASKAIMNVHRSTPSGAVTPTSSQPPHLERGTGGDETVDFSNGKFSNCVGATIWLAVVAANVYVIVELGLGHGT
ncbi:putative transporter of the NRAMP family [Laccaria bicolor S238N-H82]|uniref:Hypothetical transporter of the NRAMP family n=1 Tax=Laccaria bicolor (strain S238N-H82 / ATCC MYA-4686) TaxID=486041 RepID=B0CNV5_LACBS|nr:putative transporter of the NRAMP family [Laccaria bicolor S238N-H82]EDR15358.1 hypothetical transporter of the NRAMP family [Laccaria bicolor S238N-H82]|eukprot:XP_001873566.1 hypothetical transporter of the NRAMP family [Laccaria bicolor S238N-H82]